MVTFIKKEDRKKPVWGVIDYSKADYSCVMDRLEELSREVQELFETEGYEEWLNELEEMD